MTGQELKVRVMQVGKTQKDIADFLGVSAQSLSSVLSAKDVRSGTIEKIAKALNVSVSFLYGETEGQSALASGDNAVAVNTISGNVATGDNAALVERIALLEKLLAERERVIESNELLIKVLMEKQ